MAKKRSVKVMPQTTVEPKLTKPVRLDLDPELHQLLRIEAAKANMSMASYARSILSRVIRDQPKR